MGGGPAGSAAAITLAAAGARPELLERSRGERDTVCGGFLSWDALRALRQLGVDPHALGARPIRTLRLLGDDRRVEVRLPAPAASISRRRLDAALLTAAESAGAVIRRGWAARRADAGRRTVLLDDGKALAAEAVFLATGKHELRGLSRQVKEPRGKAAVGLRATLPTSPARERALAGTVELHLFESGYAGLALQEDGRTNLCLSVSPALLKEAGGCIARLIGDLSSQAPVLAERIGPALPKDWQTIAGVPSCWRASNGRPGVFRIGDQGAVIASLVGDGIAMALVSGRSAAQSFASGGTIASYWQPAFSRRSLVPVAVGKVLSDAAVRSPSRAWLMRLLQVAPGAARTATRLTRTR